MTTAETSLMSIFEGWDSHQLALVRAITFCPIAAMKLLA